MYPFSTLTTISSVCFVSAPDELLDVLSAMADQRRRPPMTFEEILGALRRAGLERFTAAVDELCAQRDGAGPEAQGRRA
ncbi:MAG: hypothetical protein R2735_07330 [Microthrixaceae bacterium]